ncbi:hypothetical protein J2T55_000190 [Methylohalomonas lacus]|uniref:Uncharacterized protein n=1 Tax=Methylohalomonas lacus TaxID=398773 RepID=A0AAE3L3I9_9GAMM|nr:hypothetical protein [Methylohalomonas lacus]MCS3902198.1 hypothetical protein [Methylohalomonas lacus]
MDIDSIAEAYLVRLRKRQETALQHAPDYLALLEKAGQTHGDYPYCVGDDEGQLLYVCSRDAIYRTYPFYEPGSDELEHGHDPLEYELAAGDAYLVIWHLADDSEVSYIGDDEGVVFSEVTLELYKQRFEEGGYALMHDRVTRADKEGDGGLIVPVSTYHEAIGKSLFRLEHLVRGLVDDIYNTDEPIADEQGEAISADEAFNQVLYSDEIRAILLEDIDMMYRKVLRPAIFDSLRAQLPRSR